MYFLVQIPLYASLLCAVNMQVCICRDTAGARGRDSVNKQHFRKVHGILLVYDVTDRKTFDILPKWIQHLNKVLQYQKQE